MAEGVVGFKVHAHLDFAGEPFMREFDVAAFVVPEILVCPFFNFGVGDEVNGGEVSFDFFYDAPCVFF